jgi:hypothetical protein
MSTDPETRTRGVQLALPLPVAEPAPGPTAVPDPVAAGPGGDDPTRDGRDDDRGWRLDERTRRIGIRGIAEARARLRAGSGRAA